MKYTAGGKPICGRCEAAFNMLRASGLCAACDDAEPEPKSEWREREIARLRKEIEEISDARETDHHRIHDARKEAIKERDEARQELGTLLVYRSLAEKDIAGLIAARDEARQELSDVRSALGQVAHAAVAEARAIRVRLAEVEAVAGQLRDAAWESSRWDGSPTLKDAIAAYDQAKRKRGER